MARKAKAVEVESVEAPTDLVPVKSALATLNAELATLTSPEQLNLEQRGRELLSLVKVADVRDVESYQACLEICKAAKGIVDELSARFDPFVAAGNAVHKGFVKWRDMGAGVKALDTERQAAARRAGTWYQAEQARLARIAAEEQHERERQAELARQIELDMRMAEGHDEAAEQLDAAPIVPEPPSAPPVLVAPKVVGAAPVQTWKYRVAMSATDQLQALGRRLVAVAPDVAQALAVLAPWVQLDEQRIGQMARALKQDARIPGVEVYPETTVRTAA